MTKDEALKLALDFAEDVHQGEWSGPIDRRDGVCSALREALAQEEKPKKKSGSIDRPDDVSQDCWDAFLAHRKAVKAPVTDRVANMIRKEADKAGIPLEDALDEMMARGWKGFKADWYKPMIRNDQPRKTQHQLNNEALARSLGLDRMYCQNDFIDEVQDVTTITPRLG